MLKEMFTFDRSRKTRRREIRQQLAEIEIRERRAAELSKEISSLNERADRAADLHASRCEPLQTELAATESAIREALTDRRKVAKGDERRREELLEGLAQANEDLEREAQLAASLKKPLTKERHELRSQNASSQALENQLCDEELGHPDLLDQQFVAKQASDALHRRRRAAEDALAKSEAQLRDVNAYEKASRGRVGYASGIAFLEKRVRRWRLEVGAVQTLQLAAERESQRIREALLAE